MDNDDSLSLYKVTHNAARINTVGCDLYQVERQAGKKGNRIEVAQHFRAILNWHSRSYSGIQAAPEATCHHASLCGV